MILDTLDSLPRMRFSSAQMEILLFAMRELGLRGIPSLKTLRRAQDDLREKIAIPSVRHQSIRGNIFYVNDIASQVARVRSLFLHNSQYVTKYSLVPLGLCESFNSAVHTPIP